MKSPVCCNAVYLKEKEIKNNWCNTEEQGVAAQQQHGGMGLLI